MAKLLLDENLSRRLLRFLTFHFPDSSHTSQHKLRDATDRDIWRFAGKNDFVLVSRDADFANISAIEGPPPCLVWLRLGNCGNAKIIRELTDRKELIEHAFEVSGASILEIR